MDGGEGLNKVRRTDDVDFVRTPETEWKREPISQFIYTFSHDPLFPELPKIAIIITSDPNSLFHKDSLPHFVSPTPNSC